MIEDHALTEPARRLYAAINAHDPAGILASLTDDFVGEVSAGMPLGVGGRHAGPQTMLREVWGRVFAAYDLRVQPDRYLVATDGSVVILGNYVGTERAGGHPVQARFAHVASLRDGRVCHLEQITDTRRWTPA